MISFPVVLVNSLSILMICSVIGVAWKRRSSTCSRQLIHLSAFMLVWSVGSFIEMASTDLAQKILWRNITQIGTFGTSAAALIFTITYTGFFSKYKKPLTRILTVVQAFSVTFILTDSWHHLARTSVFIAYGEQFATLVVNTTTLTKFLIALNFLYLAISLLLLLSSLFFKASAHMKKQTLCILAGALVTAVYSLIKVSFNENFFYLVPISGAFALSDLFILLGIFRYDMLMLAPTARNEVFNIVGDGIIVCLDTGKIVDMNRAALNLFLSLNPEQFKDSFAPLVEDEIRGAYPEWHQATLRCAPGRFQITRGSGESAYYYSCEVYPVKNHRRIIGTISVLSNITEQKRVNDLLRLRAEKDGLTGVNNRKTFLDQADKLLHKTNGSMCLLFMDVDHFKKINDNYGHVFGDTVLAETCRLIETKLEAGALMGRMGGEEFAVFQAVACERQAHELAEDIRGSISDHRFLYRGVPVHVTMSIGVAVGRFPSFDELYHIADQHLYQAKRAGRNQVSASVHCPDGALTGHSPHFS